MPILNRVSTLSEDYAKLSQWIGKLVATNGRKPDVIEAIKLSLERIFLDAKCHQLLVTNNIDKQFFGLRVYPVIDGSTTIKLLHWIGPENSDAPLFDKYNLEIDSKLIDCSISLLNDEIMALIVYFIYHVLYDTLAIKAITRELTYQDCPLSTHTLQSSRSLQELITYGIKDAVMKSANPLYLLDGYTVYDNEFLQQVGLAGEMYSALRSIVNQVPFLQSYMDGRFIILAWTIRVASDYKHMRAPAYKTLMKGAELTGSKLEQDMMTVTAKIIYTVESITEATNVRYNMVPDHPRTIPDALKRYRDELFYVNSTLNSPALDGPAVMDCWMKANEAINFMQEYLNQTSGVTPDGNILVLDTLQTYDRKAYEVELNNWYEVRDRCKDLKEKYLDRNDGKIPEDFINL